MMKKIFTLIILFLTLKGYAQFYSIFPSGYGSITNAFIIDTNNYYLAVNDPGTAPDRYLIYSDDGGISWTTLMKNMDKFKSEFYFFNADTGFSFDLKYPGYYHLYRTYDGIKSYDSLGIINGRRLYYNKYAHSLFYRDNDNDCLYKSSDYGENWKKVCDTLLNYVEFISENFGYGVGFDYQSDKYYFFRSTDGGDSWYSVDSTHEFRNPSFATEQIGMAYVHQSDGIKYYYDTLFKTTDGGKTWFTIVNGLPSLISENVGGIFNIYMADENTAFLVYGSAGMAKTLDIYKTIDGGNSWHYIWSTPACPASDIIGLDTNYIFLIPGIQHKECLFKTTNGGGSVSIKEEYSQGQYPNFSINPNPATEEITISSNTPLHDEYSLRLYDTKGQLLKESRISFQQSQLKIGELVSGVYILKISNENGAYIEKIVLE